MISQAPEVYTLPHLSSYRTPDKVLASKPALVLLNLQVGGGGLGGSFIPHHSASDQHSWALETLPGVTFSRTDFHCSGNKTLVLFMVTQKHGKTWKIQKKANQASMSTETTAFPWGKKFASTFWHSPPGVFWVFFSVCTYLSLQV